MPELKLLGVFENETYPFSTLCAEHQQAIKGYAALYAKENQGKWDFALIGVVPQKRGLLKRWLKGKWGFGTLATRFGGTVNSLADVHQVRCSIGFGGAQAHHENSGLPPLFFT